MEKHFRAFYVELANGCRLMDAHRVRGLGGKGKINHAPPQRNCQETDNKNIIKTQKVYRLGIVYNITDPQSLSLFF